MRIFKLILVGLTGEVINDIPEDRCLKEYLTFGKFKSIIFLESIISLFSIWT